MDQTSLPLSRETAAHALVRFTMGLYKERKEQLVQLLSMPDCLQTLAKLVGKDTETYAMRQCAACLLGNLAIPEENKTAIAALPGAIQSLGYLAALDSTRGKELSFVCGYQPIGHAARVLACIANADDNRIALTIASQPKLVDVLIDSLTNENHASVRESAARALTTLRNAPQNIQLIGSNPRVFESLMMVLKKKDPELHDTAAFAVGNLVLTPGCDLLKRNTSAALRGLVFLLGGEDSDISFRAACQLTFFVHEDEGNKKLLFNVPGVLEGLVAMLAATKTSDQQATGGTVLSMILEGNPEISLRVLAIPHALDHLVCLLSDRDGGKPEPVVYAALTIGRLAQYLEAQRIMVIHPRGGRAL